MTTATTLPAGFATVTTASATMTTAALRAMATDVRLRLVAPSTVADRPVELAGAVFRRVEAACTRFDSASPLMAANASPAEWHVVPPECFAAVDEAARAHLATGGLFDPRILEDLVRLGYDRSFIVTGGLSSGGPSTAGPARVLAADPGRRTPGTGPASGPTWRPELDPGRCAIRLGDRPIDLGGIGKGLAVRWAAAELARVGAPYLVDAGGDIAVGGAGPDGDGWLIGVEDPASDRGAEPSLVAVLRLVDTACATSSVRVRHWTVNGRAVHHLIDPRTGDSSDSTLRAVTVVGPDPAWAEVWSKSLLLLGPDGAAQACRRHRLAALWVDANGRVAASAAMRPHIIWEVSCGR